MKRHRVDARMYRSVPQRVRPLIATIGLHEGVPFKDHHAYFDTLHLLVALALYDGYGIDFPQAPDGAIVHIGGTSFGVPETKPLFDVYTHLRFLELSSDPVLRARYGRWFRNFATSSAVRARIRMTPEAYARVVQVDALVERLRESVAGACRSAGCTVE